MLRLNQQTLTSSSLQAGALDLIKTKVRKKEDGRSLVLNELINQKKEVEAIMQLSSKREKMKK